MFRSLRETLGISADGSEKIYRCDDVDAFYARPPATIPYEPRRQWENTQQVFIAVDPSGGGPSAFSICSIATLPTGGFQVASLLACTRLPPRPLGPTWSAAPRSAAQASLGTGPDTQQRPA